MNEILEVNGYEIGREKINGIVNEIITLLSTKNITHAIAYMILEDTKEQLENTIVKKVV